MGGGIPILFVIFEVPSAVSLKIQLCLDVILCRWVCIARRFEVPVSSPSGPSIVLGLPDRQS